LHRDELRGNAVAARVTLKQSEITGIGFERDEPRVRKRFSRKHREGADVCAQVDQAIGRRNDSSQFVSAFQKDFLDSMKIGVFGIPAFQIERSKPHHK
jgi:hypothetical protein